MYLCRCIASRSFLEDDEKASAESRRTGNKLDASSLFSGFVFSLAPSSCILPILSASLKLPLPDASLPAHQRRRPRSPFCPILSPNAHAPLAPSTPLAPQTTITTYDEPPLRPQSHCLARHPSRSQGTRGQGRPCAGHRYGNGELDLVQPWLAFAFLP